MGHHTHYKTKLVVLVIFLYDALSMALTTYLFWVLLVSEECTKCMKTWGVCGYKVSYGGVRTFICDHHFHNGGAKSSSSRAIFLGNNRSFHLCFQFEPNHFSFGLKTKLTIKVLKVDLLVPSRTLIFLDMHININS